MEKEEQLHNSWVRSRAYGVDPSYVEDDLLTDRELRERKQRLSTLFTACAPILDNLYQRLKSSSFMVLVSDPEGYIVFSRGNPPFTTRAKQVSLHAGANWGEHVKGTNAIGTALYEQTPMSIVGSEHYCRENHFLTCYAAPLFDPNGELLGILDVSGDARLYHPHTFDIVITAAEACQTRILLHDLKRELTLNIKELDVITDQHDGALISVDQDGVVTRLNSQAARILGEPQKKCIGRPLSDWFDQRQAANILSGKEQETITTSLKTDTKIWKVKPIKDDRQRLYRSVLTLPESYTHSTNRKKVGDDNNDTIWHCRKARNTLRLARNIARTNAAVFIHGETGTGKEVIAHEIHRASGRKGPLITVNCGAIPEALIASELFGYEKGAFTGANAKGYIGKFRAADKGTLFLDEIGEMPFTTQVVLLRALEEKRVTPIGSHQSKAVDVRIIAATNRDLAHDIQANQFRADLYFRLSEIELTLPPLRERQDLFDLAAHFLEQLASEVNVAPFTLSQAAKNRMQTYTWPGNIRELRHTLRQAAYQTFFESGSTTIDSRHLRFLTERSEQSLSDDSEIEILEREIVKARGNLAQAAKAIGIGRTTLYRKLNEYPHLKSVRAELKQKNG